MLRKTKGQITGEFVAGCGTISGNRILFRRHRMDIFINLHGALSIPLEDVSSFRGMKIVQEVKIFDEDSRIMYITDADNFRKSQDIRFISHRAGEQVLVPIDMFETVQYGPKGE
jgi:hypothetical protein